ncbi:hypothetical protein VDGE_30425 [Verticillium dahliae]|uniref:Uncharacterized protein n=1 Tax=Verticillium dahliae TaxID=27337 RepID=A0A444RJR2_VERDA|nr:hypothetical protein VDGE_30425 [Verticillium dahliae]
MTARSELHDHPSVNYMPEVASLPANGRLLRRFYEAVKFEEILIQACTQDPNSLGRAPVDVEVDTEHGAEQAFRSVVNKLAHVSDTRKGGSTVSAVCVLQEFDGIHYLVGSNQRTTASHQTQLNNFVVKLFRQLNARSREIQLAPVQSAGALEAVALEAVALGEVLRHIVQFNKPRIKFYIKGLRTQLGACIPKLRAFNKGSEDAGEHSAMRWIDIQR